ncbi:MAG TPA: dTDP-4-dehydrorhamnose reductase [Gemmatimonadales bacterium]|nr:dTDP-4-dehydrorhamnose reductase [Gemmatimonadales bacterium]
MKSGPPAKVLITGARGQVGRELQDTAPAGWHVVACGSRELDVTSLEAVRTVMERERPRVVIQLAAYTDVDRAEKEVDRARAVNVTGSLNVAAAATVIGARMIHLSTDFVFDGEQDHPYTPDAPANPLSVYGRTKLAGELEVIRATHGAALIVRTAWVYSVHGRNFVRTMLRLMKEQPSVQVVQDQVGTPTWGRALAEALWRATDNPNLHGIVHWTDGGVASWYDFALAIQEEALACGLLLKPVPVYPIRSEEFPAAARRPSYSVLDKSSGWAALGGPARHWRENLRSMLRILAHA